MRACVVLLALVCATPLIAMADTALAGSDSGLEYQRIEELRAREMADFSAREAVCYQRFAVNDCLKELQSPHRAVLADLRRQETRLHDRERAQLAAEQLQRSEEKALERQQAVEQAAAATTKERSRAPKQAAPAAGAASGAVHPAQTSGPDAAEREAHVKNLAAKQAAAQKKRQEVTERLREKQRAKPVSPLPP